MSSRNIHILLATVITFGIVVLSAALLRSHGAPYISQVIPTFTTTSTWGPEHLAKAGRPLSTYVTIYDISLPPPPLFDSDEMRTELETLRVLRRARTPSVVRAILAEQDINTANIGGIMISTLLEPEAPTALSALVSYGWKDLETHIMRQKRYFDRVRPHMLDSSIEPIIEVPGHAAYPSGHSAQIHYLALVVGLVYPDAAPDLLMQAHEVAINREIAGVHYPSDSMAGALLAEQFVAALEQDLVFQELLGAAQKEATQK